METLINILATIIKCLIIVVALPCGVAVMVYAERKILAHMQNRIGPNRVGPRGILQPFADMFKLLFKEEFIPPFGDRLIFVLAPIISLSVSLIIFAVIPLGPPLNLFGYTIPLYIADINVGLLYILAVTSLGVYGIVLAGWSSNNKYSLLGGIRSSAQMISYELAMGLAIIGMLVMAQTFSIREIVDLQGGRWFGIIPKWFVFQLFPLGFISFVIYFICAIAETNRTPFDLPEAESELVSGFMTEYSSMKYALFFMAEYINMINVSAVAVSLFWGGWHGPYAHRFPLLGVVYFLIKLSVFLFSFIWIRATLPRLRYDRFMKLGWKVFIPVTLVNIMLIGTVITIIR